MRKLTVVVKKLGKKGVRVAVMVPGRTNIQCRKRWVESLDPNINTVRWTVAEDAKLTVALMKHGSKWATVAALFPG
jgi:myb proto-oncogene protein